MQPVPLTSEEVRQQAQAERLPLLRAENKAGYFGVVLNKPGQPKPYQAKVRRGGQASEPRQLRYRRGGGPVRRAVAALGGGEGSGKEAAIARGADAQPGGAGSRTTPTTATASTRGRRMARSSGPGPGPGSSPLERPWILPARAGLATTPQGAGAGTAS